jgi:hypothetical protein
VKRWSDWHEARKTAALFLRSILLAVICVAWAPPTPARAQSASPAPIEDRARAVECLTLAIAYEAGNESTEGQQAVAEVILNRVRDPRFPKSVCGVVFAGSARRTGCQFTFTCDGSLRRPLSERRFRSARAVAETVIDGRAPAIVPGVTHYHADYVNPYWAPGLIRFTKIGAHIFYRSPGPGVAVPGGSIVVSENNPTVASMVQSPPPAPSSQPFAPWGLRITALPAAITP